MAVDSIGSIQENRVKYADYFSEKSGDEMSMESFYKLLSAEMQNQDPLEPMSNTEFISQMATFTSRETQQNALYYNNANYAQSLVGKMVSIATSNGSDVQTVSGIVTSMSLQNGEFRVMVNGTYYGLANIMEVLPAKSPFEITGSDGAFANSLIGKQVSIKGTNEETGENVMETGIVSHVEIKNEEIYIVMDKVSYPLNFVVKVEEPANDTAETPGLNDSFATSLIGKVVTVKGKDSEGDDIDATGLVNSVQLKEGKVYIEIEEQWFPVELVVQIQTPKQETGENKPSDGNAEGGTTPAAPDGTENQPPANGSETPDSSANMPNTQNTQSARMRRVETALADDVDELLRLFGERI